MDAIELVWTVVFFAAVLQGLFIAGILLTSRESDRSLAILLAALTFVFALMIGEELLDSAGLYAVWPHAALSTFAVPLAIGPLLFLCSQRLGEPAPPLRRVDLLHFLPMLAVALYMGPFYLLDAASKLTAIGGDLHARIGWLVLLKGVHVLGYQGASLFVCSRLRRNAVEATRPRIVWFQRLLLFSLVPVVLIHLLYFFPSLLAVESDRFGSLFLAVIVYSLAYTTMKRPFVRLVRSGPSAEVLGAARGEARSRSESPRRAKYRTSSLDDYKKQLYVETLLEYMKTAQPYRDPDVSLDDIAAAIEVSAHDLSQVINERLGVNFYAFVNDYRVEAVKVMMADPVNEHRTLLALGLDAGFNSKTSFNRVFKERTGTTPSELRQRLAPRPGRASQTPASATRA